MGSEPVLYNCNVRRRWTRENSLFSQLSGRLSRSENMVSKLSAQDREVITYLEKTRLYQFFRILDWRWFPTEYLSDFFHNSIICPPRTGIEAEEYIEYRPGGCSKPIVITMDKMAKCLSLPLDGRMHRRSITWETIKAHPELEDEHFELRQGQGQFPDKWYYHHIPKTKVGKDALSIYKCFVMNTIFQRANGTGGDLESALLKVWRIRCALNGDLIRWGSLFWEALLKNMRFCSQKQDERQEASSSELGPMGNWGDHELQHYKLTQALPMVSAILLHMDHDAEHRNWHEGLQRTKNLSCAAGMFHNKLQPMGHGVDETWSRGIEVDHEATTIRHQSDNHTGSMPKDVTAAAEARLSENRRRKNCEEQGPHDGRLGFAHALDELPIARVRSEKQKKTLQSEEINVAAESVDLHKSTLDVLRSVTPLERQLTEKRRKVTADCEKQIHDVLSQLQLTQDRNLGIGLLKKAVDIVTQWNAERHEIEEAADEASSLREDLYAELQRAQEQEQKFRSKVDR